VAMFMEDVPEGVAAEAPLAPSTGMSAGIAFSAAVMVAFGTVLPFLLVDLADQAATFVS